MRIAILGWYGEGNIGDDAYQIAFPLLFPHTHFQFVNKLSQASNYDAVIVGGGDVLTPPFTKQVKGLSVPVYACSVTASQVECSPQTFKHVWVRDKQSLATLQQMGFSVSLTPDLAFAIRGNAEHGRYLIKQLFAEEKRDLYTNVVVVVVNCHLFSDNQHNESAIKQLMFNKFAYDLADVTDNTNASFLFLPFGTRMPWDDRISNGVVMSKCKYWRKNLVTYSLNSVRDTVDIISAADAVISTRLHSSIFSYANDVPFVDVTHNHKNKWFLDTINKQDCSIQYHDFNASDCKYLLNRLISNMPPSGDGILQHNILHETFKNVCLS